MHACVTLHHVRDFHALSGGIVGQSSNARFAAGVLVDGLLIVGLGVVCRGRTGTDVSHGSRSTLNSHCWCDQLTSSQWTQI